MAKLFQVTETKIDSTTYLVPKVKLLGADHVLEVVDLGSGSGSIIRLSDNNNNSKVTERVVVEDKASVLALMDGDQGSVKALSLLVLNDGGGNVESTVKLIPVDYILEVESDASDSIVTLTNINSSKGRKYTVQETVANILAASNATSGGGGGDLVSTNNLSDVANAGTSLTNLGGEPTFSKNTAFNKDFGVIAGAVREGDSVVFTPTINSTNMVEVSTQEDFRVGAGTGAITLTANTTYLVRGDVSCPEQMIVDTEGIVILGWDRDKDSLTFTGTGDFLTVTDVNFELANLKLSSTNATPGEVVLRATNFDIAEYNSGRSKIFTIINCQFRNCFDVHFIKGFDLVDIQQTLFWYIQATSIGCQFQSVSKLQISSCEYVRWFDETSIPTPLPADYATTPMVELLTGAGPNGFGAVNINGSILHPQETQYGLKISPTSTTGFGTISGNTFINIGLTTGAVSDFDYSVQNAYIIQANQGLINGNAKGTLQVTGNIIALDYAGMPVASNTIVYKPANTTTGLFTNLPTFPNEVRVITNAIGFNNTKDNLNSGMSFTYNNKNDGNFFIVVTATVEYDNTGGGGGLKNGFIECVLRGGDGTTQVENLTSIGRTEVKGFANSFSFSVIGTATIGSVFDIVFKTYNDAGVAVDDRGLIVSEFVLNGYQF